MSKILITGNLGFVGSYLQDELVKQQHEVYGIDSLAGGFLRNKNKECCTLISDLNDADIAVFVREVKPEILVHVAASAREGSSFFEPLQICKDNFLAYSSILEACIRAGNLRLVNCYSSMASYGKGTPPFKENDPLIPEDPYAINKVSMEQLTEMLSRCYSFKYSITVPHNVIGPHQSIRDNFRNVAGIFMNRIMRNETLYVYGDGEQERQFSYIKDALPSMIKMIDEKYHRERMNIGGINVYTVNQLLELIIEEFKNDYKIPKIVHTPARFGEVKHAYCSPDKSIKLLEYKEVHGVEQGIKDMSVWAKELGPQEWSKMKLAIKSDKWPESWKIHHDKINNENNAN